MPESNWRLRSVRPQVPSRVNCAHGEPLEGFRCPHRSGQCRGRRTRFVLVGDAAWPPRLTVTAGQSFRSKARSSGSVSDEGGPL